MQKDKSLKNIAIIAAVLSGANVLLNVVNIFVPFASKGIMAELLYSGRVEIEKLPMISIAILIVKAMLPLMLTGLCLFNAVSKNMTRQKGLMTAVMGGLFYLVMRIGSYLLNILESNVTMRIGGAVMIHTISIINISGSFLDYLNIAALVLIVSSAAVETYAASHTSQQ